MRLPSGAEPSATPGGPAAPPSGGYADPDPDPGGVEQDEALHGLFLLLALCLILMNMMSQYLYLVGIAKLCSTSLG